ncbi:MAG: methionyl-tRNA formyltransferase [Planctomycetes bacterium]|nr:methionyl-tRNA formyltransferase [Planctomycetota bacterium]
MRTIFMGTPEFAATVLEALLGSAHQVACVVTQPDRPSGRHHAPVPPPVKELALARGLPVLQTDDVNEPAFAASLAAWAPEAIVVAAFGQKLGQRLLALPPRGCINVHASLLPRHRGAAPVAHAILAGDEQTGITIIRMAGRIDAGDILAQQAVPIAPADTTGSLTQRLAELGGPCLVGALTAIEAGHARAVPQDHRLATFAPALDKSGGAVPWSRPAAYLERFVRAMNPWPGAFTFWQRPGKPPLRIVIHTACAIEGQAACPGRVAAAGGGSLAIETGEGLLQPLLLQPAGSRPMSAADFLRGHRLAPGDLFVSSLIVGGASVPRVPSL